MDLWGSLIVLSSRLVSPTGGTRVTRGQAHYLPGKTVQPNHVPGSGLCRGNRSRINKHDPDFDRGTKIIIESLGFETRWGVEDTKKLCISAFKC